MTDLPLELDHVGVAVNDLDVGRDAYQRLGFTLTPRSIHSGSKTPGGPVEPWGSGNHCAMFQEGYLELIGLTDPDLYSSAQAMLERHQGAHIVAIGSGEADAAYAALAARFEGVEPPSKLQRDASFGPDGEETRLAAFRNIYLAPESFPEAMMIFIEHLTRDVLWQPHLLDHPNGAVAMAEVVFCVADVAATSGRLQRLFGAEPTEPQPGAARFAFERGAVYVIDAARLAIWTPGVEPPCLPYVAAVGITVRDLGATKDLLSRNGVDFTDHPYPAIWVGPADTCGPVLSFIQA
ncbi:MAG: VOC family protein [Alphaproteobacteria bacterium]|jgi:hypothetical protein|nr:VOC family protein [Alphaproteobacteria bacterium]